MITKTPCGMKEHYEWSIPESRQTTNVFLLSSSVVFAQSSSSFILSSALAHCFFATSKSHEVLKSSRSKSMVSFVTPFSSLVHIAYMLFMVASSFSAITLCVYKAGYKDGRTCIFQISLNNQNLQTAESKLFAFTPCSSNVCSQSEAHDVRPLSQCKVADPTSYVWWLILVRQEVIHGKAFHEGSDLTVIQMLIRETLVTMLWILAGLHGGCGLEIPLIAVPPFLVTFLRLVLQSHSLILFNIQWDSLRLAQIILV